MKDKFDAVIVADGDFPTAAYPLQVLADANFIACCDGAIQQLEQCGINPDVIVGDCDSISLQLKEKFADRIYHIEEQDDNDLTKTVRYLQQKGMKSFAILGATGKREDHTLGNISLLLEYMRSGLNVKMFTDYGCFIPCNGNTSFACNPGQQISIFSFGATNFGSEGLVYPLFDFNALWQGTLNECTSSSFTIFAEGDYLIFINYDNRLR